MADENEKYKDMAKGAVSEVIEAEARIAELEEALKPFARVLSTYGSFAEHQLILLSEDNPKGRRLAHLFPENFTQAQAALEKGASASGEDSLVLRGL